MNVIHRRRIVVLVNVTACTVDQRGIERVEALFSRQKTCRGLAGKRRQCTDKDIDRRLTASSDCATDKIKQRPPGLVDYVGGDVVDPARHDV